VIAVFTKYDQFKRDIGFKLEDQNLDPALLNAEVERIFKEEYLVNLRGSAPFVCLESKIFVNLLAWTTLICVLQGCTRMANNAPNLLKRLPMSSLATLFLSCSWLFRRIIWS
jgi:hypothetical protein